jgi:hypothetical protein
LIESPNPVVGGRNVKVSGTNFKPGTVTLTYYANTIRSTAPPATAAANCTFSMNVKTNVVLGVGATRVDSVVACDSANRCTTVRFTTKTRL